MLRAGRRARDLLVKGKIGTTYEPDFEVVSAQIARPARRVDQRAGVALAGKRHDPGGAVFPLSRAVDLPRYRRHVHRPSNRLCRRLVAGGGGAGGGGIHRLRGARPVPHAQGRAGPRGGIRAAFPVDPVSHRVHDDPIPGAVRPLPQLLVGAGPDGVARLRDSPACPFAPPSRLRFWCCRSFSTRPITGCRRFPAASRCGRMPSQNCRGGRPGGLANALQPGPGVSL